MKRAILVKSCQKNRDRQDACAASWVGHLDRCRTRIRFIEGDAGRPHYGEAVIMVTAGDSYDDNSLKLRSALRMCLDSRDEFTHFFICDDDTFVHPKRWLAHEPAGEIECRVFTPRNALEWKRNNGRPWIHGGAGWWMSRRMCELYVDHCRERTSADDMVAARIAQDHGIELVDRPDLYGDNSYGGDAGVVSAENSLITCHPVMPDEMRSLYEATHGI